MLIISLLLQMEKIPRVWCAIIAYTLRENYVPGDYFTRQEYLDRFLESNVDYMCPEGITPEQTISEDFQQLSRGCDRFDPIIAMHSKAFKDDPTLNVHNVRQGVYRYLRHITDGELEMFGSNNSLGEDMVFTILKELTLKYQFRIQTQKKIKGMINKGSLSFDFFLKLDYKNFLGYKHIALEFNGLQHREAVEFFGGWEKFVIQVKSDDIKFTTCDGKKFLLIQFEMLDKDKIREALEMALQETFDLDKFQRIKMKKGYLFPQFEKCKNWYIPYPTFGIYRDQEFHINESIAVFYLDTELAKDDKKKITFDSNKLPKLLELCLNRTSIVLVGRVNTKYTEDVIRYRQRLEAAISLLEFPVLALIAFGMLSRKSVNKPLFGETLDKIFPEARKKKFYTSVDDDFLDSGSPTREVLKSFGFKCLSSKKFFQS